MKTSKQNKNIILFAGYIVFIICGVLSLAVLRPIGGSIYRFVSGQYTLAEAKSTINAALTDGLNYHAQMINLNGFRENILGTKVIQKEDAFVVKAESGSLIAAAPALNDNEVFTVAKSVQDLQNVSEENEALFLYCAAPRKEMYEEAPSNISNYAQYNYEQFLSVLTEMRVPCVDLAKKLDEAGIPASDIFYDTDHHWKAFPGFVAANAICEELNQRYRFGYNEEYTDISNYTVEEYKDWFLGSRGKKTGVYFSQNGADDFQLILPKFETDMTEEQPYKKQIRKGKFEETVLYMDNMRKDYYKVNTYATYSGGDFRLQIMKNNLNPEGKKILLIRDSFACVVAPFLALQTSELHICDVRSGYDYVGEKLNMEAYIQQIKPDYVLVLYTGVGDMSDSRYDFF